MSNAGRFTRIRNEAPQEAIDGLHHSFTGSGVIGEFDFNAWQNARVGIQYIAYNRFNGASVQYDMPGGRRAADNNSLYLSLWVAF